MLKRFWNARFTRFVVFGGVGTGIYWVIFITAQVWSGPGYLLFWATFASVVNYSVNFFLQRWLTFDHRDTERIGRHAIGYVTLYASLTGFNDVLLYAFIDWMHIWWLLAQAVAGIILTVVSYPVSIVIFRHITPSRAS